MNRRNITDDLEEVLDIVDEDDRVIGFATRRECNSNPNLIHRAAYILVFDSTGKLFLHKRAKTKDTFPGKWSISVAGHVNQGEDYKETIFREMKEEIGVTTEPEFLGKFLLKHASENEYAAVFRGYSEGPFQLNPDEIEEGGFFRMDEVRNDMWDELTPFSRMVIVHLTEKELI